MPPKGGLSPLALSYSLHPEMICGMEGLNFSQAIGDSAHAEGSNTIANGIYFHAGGFFTIAQNNYQMAIGKFSVASNPALNGTPGDDAFIIGNGLTIAARTNAFRVLFNGNVFNAPGVYTTGADYAEMFEWQDGNPDNEDRRGLFVTLCADRIRQVQAGDDYILGVISATPSVVGDVQGNSWKDMYRRDEWGAILYKAVPQDGGEVLMPMPNPAYEAERDYRPRSERPEWAAVGPARKLPVPDDGSCRPDGYCIPNAGGRATASPRRYRVLKRTGGSSSADLADRFWQIVIV